MTGTAEDPIVITDDETEDYHSVVEVMEADSSSTSRSDLETGCIFYIWVCATCTLRWCMWMIGAAAVALFLVMLGIIIF